MRLLFRTFVAQFAAGETVTSDLQMRRAAAGLVATVITPGLLLLLEVFPDYQSAVVRVHAHRAPPGLIDDRLEWVVLMLCAYSMATVGLVATFAWDALAFDRRDASVLGPLPIAGRTIITAKLAALAALLLGTAAAVNGLNAFVFAFETSDLLGARALVAHGVGILVATMGAATMVFASIVTLRCVLALWGNARSAAIAGSLLQGGFVLALLYFVAVTPFVASQGVRFAISQAATDRLPWTWFVGLFEAVRQSPRREWPEFATLFHRAALSLAISIGAALGASILAFRRQMAAALTPSARPGRLGHARAIRALARLVAGRDRSAAAIADFVLLTIARNRSQQGYVAMNVAVGAAWAMIGVARGRDAAAAIRAAPLLVAFWAIVGLRAAFFVPSELPAAWVFRVHARDGMRPLVAGVRASIVAFVLPPTAIAAWIVGGGTFAVSAAAIVVVLATASVLTIDFVPFTRPYVPGHARLKTRWPLYAIASAATAYALPHLPLWALVGGAGVLYALGDYRGRRWTVEPSADLFDDSTITVLDLVGARGV
ncbi:MAG TPA: hypothetical protein VFB07_00895 [Vicinamibacterales bacterium]|nr:hypothetical protein [Vicinamibacterales bacterium]